jgi:hypothetical protein
MERRKTISLCIENVSTINVSVLNNLRYGFFTRKKYDMSCYPLEPDFSVNISLYLEVGLLLSKLGGIIVIEHLIDLSPLEICVFINDVLFIIVDRSWGVDINFFFFSIGTNINNRGHIIFLNIPFICTK